jgi:Zn finger protein HypA/HybF involved in hydrogenase expression
MNPKAVIEMNHGWGRIMPSSIEKLDLEVVCLCHAGAGGLIPPIKMTVPNQASFIKFSCPDCGRVFTIRIRDLFEPRSVGVEVEPEMEITEGGFTMNPDSKFTPGGAPPANCEKCGGDLIDITSVGSNKNEFICAKCRATMSVEGGPREE